MTTARSTRLTQSLLQRLASIREEFSTAERDYGPALDVLPAATRDCARNLVDYVALRRHDLRAVQRWLHSLGVSSLGHTESHVRAGLDVVLALLGQVVQSDGSPALNVQQRAMRRSRVHLKRRTVALLGVRSHKREVRIMVTMPSEAASDPQLVRGLLDAGMDCMRINCAHDSPPAWQAMIDHLRLAQDELHRPCRVLMDLAGPKLRTGPVAGGPAVRRWRPQRDAFGRETAPARVTLVPEGTPAPYGNSGDVTLPVPPQALAALQVGDLLHGNDSRDKARELTVVSITGGMAVCEAWKTAYVTPGTGLIRDRDGFSFPLGDFTGRPGRIALQAGDLLVLDNRADWPGTPAVRDGEGNLLRPARIPFTLPQLFGQIKPGHPVFFDDGKIAAVVDATDRAALTLRITQTRPGGAYLQADKGVNLPESQFTLPALSEKDREHLAFAIGHADLVGLSFVRTAKDVEALFDALKEGNGKHLGVILKIETRQGVMNLPDLLLTALRHDRVGVMIARGDLAIECDFRRMAELQEEILWFCEAAHVPVIWATEVLERLAKTGMPTRAEITDAAMAERAECVMLNKGPYITQAIHVLDDILKRMSGHQHKKMARLRPLRLANLTKPPRAAVPPPTPPVLSAPPAPPVPPAQAAPPPAPSARPGP
jgi:pyruvate kinase